MFHWNGQPFRYFDHPYNSTARNMRRVEIPIARWFVEQALYAGNRILEVGNVLSHYIACRWDVVDLREKGAINADVMEWRPAQPVDLLISISTIEHIHFGKFARAGAVNDPAGALARFKSFLAVDGLAVVTAPTNYNPVLDAQLKGGTLGADGMWFMRLVGDNEWEECTMDEALAMSPKACDNRWSGGLMILMCGRAA